MEERDFQLYLILSSIDRGAHRLEEIARECGGLYPLELRNLLDELIEKGLIIFSKDGYHLASIEKQTRTLVHPNLIIEYNVDLPEPHPHDYDWRFDSGTSRHLSKIVIDKHVSGGSVLLLGEPSMLIEMLKLKDGPKTILLDRSQELINYLHQYNLPESISLVNHDLLSGSLWKSNEEVTAVLCDPPWYPEYYDVFLAQASFVSSLGAVILLSLLPANTRPDAINDRWRILENAHKLGLHVEAIMPNAIQYKNPSFELASLHSVGIDLIDNWRRADLVVLRKAYCPAEGLLESLLISAKASLDQREEWKEILLDRYKVKLRSPFDDNHELPELISIVKGNTLPTVSRRYEGRKLVDLWLWDNRVFGIKGKASFWAALHTLAGRPIPKDLPIISKPNHQRAFELLQQITGDIYFK